MPLVRIPDHRFFQNGNDAHRMRDALVVDELCKVLDLTHDEAIDFLTRVGLVILAKRDARIGGVPCRRLLELARMWGVTTDGEG